MRYTSGLPREVGATEHVSALLRRLSPSAPHIGALSEIPETEVTLSVGYFVNEPQWQDRDEGFLIRGLGVALDNAEISAPQRIASRRLEHLGLSSAPLPCVKAAAARGVGSGAVHMRTRPRRKAESGVSQAWTRNTSSRTPASTV